MWLSMQVHYRLPLSAIQPVVQGGGATILTRFIHIAYRGLWEMFQGCVIFDCRILVARVNGTSNTTTTHILGLNSR